jgi:hypothetical protein
MQDENRENTIKDNIQIKDKYYAQLFNNDYDAYLLYKRVQNITAAILLVTQDLSDNESIKLSLKNTCLKCINRSVSFITMFHKTPEKSAPLVESILELGALLNTAYYAGFISEMNITLLKLETQKLEQNVVDITERYHTKFALDTKLFAEVDQHMRHHQAAVQAKMTLDQRHVSKAEPQVQKIEKSIPRKTDRREAILALLRQKGNLSIKDFLSVVKDISEKTIQRELIVLVQEGLVKKEGERRWSTYSLA